MQKGILSPVRKPKAAERTRLPYNEDTHNQARTRREFIAFGLKLAGSHIDFELLLLDVIAYKIPGYVELVSLAYF